MPMQTRTDQVHSYEFFLQRIVSGLVARESDPAELPFRRLGWSGFGSIMLTIVVAGVFAIVGLLVGGGNDRWRNDNTIVVEKGHETIYVYINERLHPMANMVSAQLLRPGGDVVRVSSRSLEGVPRGETLGIVGAPNLPPDSDDLLTDAWSLCSQEQQNNVGATETISVVGVGQAPAGGLPVGDAQGVLVRDIVPGDPSYYLVWHGYRYQIDPEDSDVENAVLRALEVSATDALPVSSAWVDALPEGQLLTLPPNYAPGQQSVAIPGEDLTTGQVIQDGSRYYLVRAEGLDEITGLQAGIVGRFSGEVEPVQLGVPGSVQPTPLPAQTDTSPPREAPDIVNRAVPDRSACAVFPPGVVTPTVLMGGELDPQNATRRVSPEGTRLADYVAVEGGKAVLVQSLQASDPIGAWHIVNDQGTKYSLLNAATAEAFGYPIDRGVGISGGLVDLLDSGPDLDPAAADNLVLLEAADQRPG